MAVHVQLLLRQWQRFAAGHAQLPLHQIEAGDGFGHRVLDLQPRVHLHEIKPDPHAPRCAWFAAPRGGCATLGRPGGGAPMRLVQALHDELHGTGAHVVHRPGRRHRSGAHLRAQLGRHARRGRFFQHLLVAPLHRAVALEQIHAVAVRVAKHLDLDVARALGVFLHQHGVAAEAVDGLTLARSERGGKVLSLLHRAHALAAAAGAGLDQHRVTDAVGLVLQQGGVLIRAVVARHQRHASALHQSLGLGLQAHGLDGAGGRADEHQTGLGAGVGKGFVLAQETVAGVDGLRAGGLGGIEDALPLQVAVFRRAGADVHRLVAGRHVFGAGVGVGIHGHGAQAHAAGGGGDAAGDFTAVGDQDFFKHGVPP